MRLAVKGIQKLLFIASVELDTITNGSRFLLFVEIAVSRKISSHASVMKYK